jgi:glycosyltransferase involved in cell wall biosynthesis
MIAAPKANKKDAYIDNESFEVIRCASTKAPENYRLGFPSIDSEFVDKIVEKKFDVLHTQSPFIMGRFAIKAAKKQGVPVVATIHTQYHQDFARVLKGNKCLVKFMIRYIMKVYNKADSVWTVNDSSCEILRSYGYKGKIEVVRNGTDLKYPKNDKELIDKVNALHNLEGKKNVFVFVGRIAMYKNLGLMADALKILSDNGEDFRMLIIGDGFDMVKFKKIVEENGLNDKVIFVGSVSDRELLQGYYLRSDLFLFPSTFDTSSLVPIEAAAHKLPTLLIEGSYTAENIKGDFNGFLAKETPQAFAEKIKEIISTEGLAEKVGEEAHRSVYRTWEMVAEEVKEKYAKIIEEYNLKKQAKKKK